MKERPILFKAEMVRAILDGRKTQTRRVIKPALFEGEGAHIYNCPHGKPGYCLWVKETWQTHCDYDDKKPSDLPKDIDIQYPATYDGWVSKKRSSIHMPRWASRIDLLIKDIRVERLQDISEDDAKAEGMTFPNGMMYGNSPKDAFKNLWWGIHPSGPRSWEANPFVWVIEFERIKP